MTYFEAMTAAAFLLFAGRRLDLFEGVDAGVEVTEIRDWLWLLDAAADLAYDVVTEPF